MGQRLTVRVRDPGGIAERDHVAVGQEQPVAAARGVGHHGIDGGGAAAHAGAGPGEVGVTKGEHPTVTRHHKVTLAV